MEKQILEQLICLLEENAKLKTQLDAELKSSNYWFSRYNELKSTQADKETENETI